MMATMMPSVKASPPLRGDRKIKLISIPMTTVVPPTSGKVEICSLSGPEHFAHHIHGSVKLPEEFPHQLPFRVRFQRKKLRKTHQAQCHRKRARYGKDFVAIPQTAREAFQARVFL